MSPMRYTPSREAMEVLDRALEHVQSVPYKVSARWLFYRLLQEGIYSHKSDYKRLLGILSKARKRFWGGWSPDTLADETRVAFYDGHGSNPVHGPKQWVDGLHEKLELHYSHWFLQEAYVECWFEAKAMSGQFQHYLDGVTLRPFGGDPSIPYKWKMAQELHQFHVGYEKPVVVCYFGDLDPKGQQIPESAYRDVASWCMSDFEFHWCGLTLDQVDEFEVPEDPDRPGKYQWEALDDDEAGRIILDQVGEYVAWTVRDEVADQRARETEEYREKCRVALEGVE